MSAVPRTYGLPFTGSVTTLEDHELPLGALTGDSRDVLLKPGASPNVVKVVRRQGAQSLGSPAGVLEVPVGDANMRGLEVFRCASPSLSDGYPTHGILFADEDRYFGQLYLRDTNGPQDYTLLEEFGATHYPTGASATANLRVIPVPYDGNGATGYTRGAFEENRRRVGSGSRRHIGMRGKEHLPSFQGCPISWNRRYNRSALSGSEVTRLGPTGHPPPTWIPTFPTASYAAGSTTVYPWAEGDTFYATCFAEYADGSFGPPAVPRAPNAILTGSFGLVTVYDDADGTAEYYPTIPWRNIPVFGPDCVRVWLARTPKISKTSYAAGSRPDISDLRICGYVPNGVTSYDDPNGNDLSLVQDDNILRFDHKWPDRARYAWAFDQRVAFGYLRQNPCAIILHPLGSAADYDRNVNDSANPGSVFFHFRIDATNFTIKKTSGGITTKVDIALSGKTLQQVVDTINATTSGSASGQWRAALVPGMAGATLATDLAPTSQDVSCTTTINDATIVGSSFDAVPEGAKITGTGVPAGTYFKSRTNGTTGEMSANATASGAVTLTFYSDFGDDSNVADSTYGNCRCYCPSFFGVAALKQSALDAIADDATQDFTFTAGGTTHARCAPESFYTSIGNRRSALFGDQAGVLMGGAPLNDGCVVFYAKHIYWLRNLRAGGTGEDADYQLYVLELGRGCISPWSVVYGNGWVGCLTQDGWWVFDGTGSGKILSRDTLKRTHGGDYIGEWSYEANLCAAAAEANTTDAHFYACFDQGRLWVGYRVSATVFAYQCYDASPSLEASGTAQLLRADGSSYGWSSRLRYTWRGDFLGCSGALGAVRTAAGPLLIACDDRNDKTYGGLVQQIEVPGLWNDGGTPVLCDSYLVRDLVESLKLKSLQSARVLYWLNDPSAELTAVVRPILNGSASNYSRALAPSASGQAFTRKEIPFAMQAGSPTEAIQWYFGVTAATGDGADFEVAGIETMVNTLASYQ